MPTASTATVIDLLQHREILTASQLDEMRTVLAPRLSEPQALLEELVGRGWLTAFQARHIANGKGADLVLDRYLLLDTLGKGASGQVFKARHRTMQRLVALKVLRPELIKDPDAVQRFYREIEVASQLSHPNIVHAYEAGPIGALLVLVMEYVDGPDLERLVRESGPLPVGKACEFIRQAAVGLQYASERGLVHRDIKPSNLLLQIVDRRAPLGHPGPDPSASGKRQATLVKILDLGLARLQQPVRGSETANLTIASSKSVMQGTPDYMAPEQALDFHGADSRSDIYSLGCTFFYLLSGRPPFPGSTLAEKLLKHQQAEPPIEALPEALPPALAKILRKMLAKQPTDRYQTPGDVVADLLPFCPGAALSTWDTLSLASQDTQDSLSTKAAVAFPKKARAVSAYRVTAAALALGLLLVISLGVVWLALSKQQRPATERAVLSPKRPPSERLVASPKERPPTYLSDLPEIDPSVGFGRFGKKGQLGFGERAPEQERIQVKGVLSPNGLSMHPPPDGDSRTAYQLGKQYHSFQGTAAIDDSAASSGVHLVFLVLGDGKELWQSKPLRQPGDKHECKVSVQAVERLELRVHCTGTHVCAHAVWLEPLLTK
jgi:serine/threonine-protein kinase